MKNKNTIVIALFGMFIGCLIWFGLHRVKSQENIDPETKEGRARLITIGRNGQQIVDGIRQYRRAHGSFPDKLDQLSLGKNALSDMIPQCTYIAKDGPCGLTYKINTDSNLKYVCEEEPFKRRYWKYNPGGTATGSEIMIDKSDR